MANRLKMATVHSILTLHERGWSARRIARELQVNRQTVSRHVRLAKQATSAEPGDGSNPAHAPISPAGESALPNPANAPTGAAAGRGSDCQPWREPIEAKQAQGLSARRIYQDLVAEHGATVGYDKVLSRYLKPDLLIIDDMGMKQLPRRSGEVLFEIIMRRYEARSTMMTSNRPLEDWGKLVGDVPSATAILDRFLHHAEIIAIAGKSYRLRHQTDAGGDSKPANAPISPAGSPAARKRKTATTSLPEAATSAS
jgi:hypothetical protein